MNIRLLSAPPTSGTVQEAHFNARGDCLWALFEPVEGEAWAGVFGLGSSMSTATTVAWLHVPPLAYVIARGRNYLIDCTTRQLRTVFEDSRAKGVIGVPWLRTFIIWDSVLFQGVDEYGKGLWVSRRAAWDGIRKVRIDGLVVVGEGKGAGDHWVPFELDPQNGALSGGGYTPGPWDEAT